MSTSRIGEKEITPTDKKFKIRELVQLALRGRDITNPESQLRQKKGPIEITGSITTLDLEKMKSVLSFAFHQLLNLDQQTDRSLAENQTTPGLAAYYFPPSYRMLPSNKWFEASFANYANKNLNNAMAQQRQFADLKTPYDYKLYVTSEDVVDIASQYLKSVASKAEKRALSSSASTFAHGDQRRFE